MLIRRLVVSGLAVLLLAGAGRADWKTGDPYKMHFPQLPDLLNGMNVNATAPKILADDFRCTQTGLITDIHIWGSWWGWQPETPPPPALTVDLYLFKDVPASVDPNGNAIPSHPGELVWARPFQPVEIEIGEITPWNEPFFDPNTNEVWGPDFAVIQYNFYIPDSEAFRQELGTIYWLGVQKRNVEPIAQFFGWKSSADHWNDDAVYADIDPAGFPGMQPPGPNIGWNELIDPTTGLSMDLAFVITPEPATMALLALGGLGLALRRRRT